MIRFPGRRPDGFSGFGWLVCFLFTVDWVKNVLCELCQPLQKVNLVVVLGLRGQILVAVKATGMASVGSYQKLPS